MEVTKQLPVESKISADEYEAVAVIHKTMVTLRDELQHKDHLIQQLQAKLQLSQHDLNTNTNDPDSIRSPAQPDLAQVSDEHLVYDHVARTEARPILRPPSSAWRSVSGSQTDISALPGSPALSSDEVGNDMPNLIPPPPSHSCLEGLHHIDLDQIRLLLDIKSSLERLDRDDDDTDSDVTDILLEEAQQFVQFSRAQMAAIWNGKRFSILNPAE